MRRLGRAGFAVETLARVSSVYDVLLATRGGEAG